MKNAGLRMVVLMVMPTLWLGISHAQSPGGPGFNLEFSKQESIYWSAGEQVPSGYTIDRTLANYVDALSSDFDRTLANLGPQDRWLDVGAGKGLAILDYYHSDYDLTHQEGRERRGRKAQAVAISIEDRRTPLWQQFASILEAKQILYLFSKRLREYSLADLGQFQVITDVIGGFSYTENLSLFVEKVLSFLALNGTFYTVLQDVHSEEGANKPHYPKAPYLTEIVDTDRSAVKVCSWLKSISCVEVTCEFRGGWRPPVEAYRVRKVCDAVTVPALTSVHFEAGTPPERRFELRSGMREAKSP